MSTVLTLTIILWRLLHGFFMVFYLRLWFEKLLKADAFYLVRKYIEGRLFVEMIQIIFDLSGHVVRPHFIALIAWKWAITTHLHIFFFFRVCWELCWNYFNIYFIAKIFDCVISLVKQHCLLRSLILSQVNTFVLLGDFTIAWS